MTAVIIGGGDFPRKPFPRYLIATADIIICCDGALVAYLRAAPVIFGGKTRRPDAVVGDMDSLPTKLRKEYSDVIVHFSEQENNDQTKSVYYLLEKWPDVDTIHILGATGKRADHTIGNISLLMEYGRKFPRIKNIELDMVSDYETIFPIWNSCTLAVGKGRRVSIITPDKTLEIKSKGLEYDTAGVVFDNWWKATLNRATEDEITLDFSHPSAAVVILD